MIKRVRLNVRRVVLGIFLLIATSAWADAQGKLPEQAEQKHFSAEAEGVDRPVPLPDDVLKSLENDDMVRKSVEDSDPPVHMPPSSWFSASNLHLADPKEADMVVLAEGTRQSV